MRRLKAWLRTVFSWAYWRYLRLKGRAHSKSIVGMSRQQAIQCGLIDPVRDADHFDAGDAWPVDRDQVDTLETVANTERDFKKRAELQKQVIKAKAATGTGTDVNSMAWGELMQRLRER